MTFLQNLDKIDDSELYSALVARLQSFCASRHAIQPEDCDLIRMSRSENIHSDIETLNLSDQGKRIVAEVFEVHRRPIWNATIDKLAAGQIGSSLIAFDWQANLVLANAHNRNLMQPLLKLSLSIQKSALKKEGKAEDHGDQNGGNANGCDPETLSFELNPAELEAFIATLEEARKELIAPAH